MAQVRINGEFASGGVITKTNEPKQCYYVIPQRRTEALIEHVGAITYENVFAEICIKNDCAKWLQ